MSINIFGVVGEDVRASDIITKIQKDKSDPLEVNIMSPGGSVTEGLAIYDFMRDQKRKVITRAMGQAASIASIIFMAGDEREVADNAEIMIHNAWAGVAGNKHELAEFIDRLDDTDQKLINIYSTRSNLNEDQVRDLLDKETFMDAEQAVSQGFATSKANALELVAQYNKSTNETKEPVKMATEEETKAGFLAHMMAYFKQENKAEGMPEEEQAMEEEEEKKAMEEGDEPEAKAEESSEEPKAEEEVLPESEDDDAEKAELIDKVKALEEELAEAKAKAEDEPKAVKEEAVSAAGLILDALTDDKITMHEAKNLSAKDLTGVQAVLKDKDVNATGRGKSESPKGEAKISAYEQYADISDPAERQAFFAKNKDQIINQSKES